MIYYFFVWNLLSCLNLYVVLIRFWKFSDIGSSNVAFTHLSFFWEAPVTHMLGLLIALVIVRWCVIPFSGKGRHFCVCREGNCLFDIYVFFPATSASNIWLMLEDKSLVPASSMGIPEEPTQLQSTLWDCLKPLLLPYYSYLLFSPILPLLPCSCFLKEQCLIDHSHAKVTCFLWWVLIFLLYYVHYYYYYYSHCYLVGLFSIHLSQVQKLIFSAVQFSTINIQKVLNFRYCMLQLRNVHLILFKKSGSIWKISPLFFIFLLFD